MAKAGLGQNQELHPGLSHVVSEAQVLDKLLLAFPSAEAGS